MLAYAGQLLIVERKGKTKREQKTTWAGISDTIIEQDCKQVYKRATLL
jgi:hypothetical protein